MIGNLEEALARNTEHPNAGKIRRLREIMFADVDELETSGQVKLPD